MTGPVLNPSESLNAMNCEYGYLARTAGRYYDNAATGPPSAALIMARENFLREFGEMLRFFSGEGEDGAEAMEEECLVRVGDDGEG